MELTEEIANNIYSNQFGDTISNYSMPNKVRDYWKSDWQPARSSYAAPEYRVGDTMWAEHPLNKEWFWAKVVKVIPNQTNSLYLVYSPAFANYEKLAGRGCEFCFYTCDLKKMIVAEKSHYMLISTSI